MYIVCSRRKEEKNIHTYTIKNDEGSQKEMKKTHTLADTQRVEQGQGTTNLMMKKKQQKRNWERIREYGKTVRTRRIKNC